MDKEHHQKPGIAVVGFPYVRESYFAMFRAWPAPDVLRFFLPKRWPIKAGKVIYTAPQDSRVSTGRAFFANYRHAYPVIGGLLKGWMPGFPLFLITNIRHIDIVYACSEPILLTTLYYAFWTKLFRKRLVLFTWENIPYEKKFHGFSRLIHGMLLRLNLWLADGLMCGNSAGLAIHRELTRKPLAVIPMNGLDVEQFTRREGPRASTLTSRIVYAFVGAIGERKGIHVILQALPRVLERVPSAHLIIAGSGEYEARIDVLIGELGLRDRVTRLPWITHHEMIRLLSAADVFVYPSIPRGGWAEQFGYSMAEASLLELPVISTHSGSIPDVVREGETGILVPPEDVSALAAAMIRLGTDGELRRRMGVAGRKYIAEAYSHKSIARKMYDFFQML